MTLLELLTLFRQESGDLRAPYFWADTWVKTVLNEAVAEAAIRGRLIHESADAAVCTIAVTAGQAVYPLHAALYEIDYLAFTPTGASRRQPVRLVSSEDMDELLCDWREAEGRIDFAIQSDTAIRLVRKPTDAGTLYLEGFRLPIVAMSADADVPPINQAHHRHLVHWALHRAFLLPDSDTVDKDRAALAERVFTDYFGERPDSDLRRSTRHDSPHHNKVDW